MSKAATGLEKGEKQQKCTVCGEVLDTQEYELSAGEKMAAYKQQCQTYSYNEVARNPSAYIGKYAVFTGEVVQVVENDDDYVLRVNVTKGRYIWEDTIYVTYTKKDSTEARILEDDIVTLYGMLFDTYTYKTVMGNSITIPYLMAEYCIIN